MMEIMPDHNQQLKDVLPARKRKHSLRVADAVFALNPTNREAANAALFHDFIEQGGNVCVLIQKLGFSQRVVEGILALTLDKYDPLEHLQKVFPELDEETRNLVIIVKLCDRLDNLKIRKDARDLKIAYIQKSLDLVKWLFKQYTGDVNHLYEIRARFKELGLKIKKKHICKLKAVA